MYTPDSAYIQIERLIHKFKALTLNQRRAMNEDATRQGYILPLFAALGWETSNINEVSPEEKVSRGFMDFAFRIRGDQRAGLSALRAYGGGDCGG